MAMQPPMGPPPAGATNPPAGTVIPPASGAQLAAPANAHVPNVVGRRGWRYPRWPLLASIVLAPFVVVGELINLYYTYNDCNLGYLCNLDQLPGVVQVLLIWFAFGLLWLLSLIFGVTWLEGPTTSNVLATFLRRVSDFEAVRWLLVSYGALTLFGVLFGIFLHRLTPPAFALATVVVIVALYSLFWRPRVPDPVDQSALGQMQQTARQAGTPWFVLRSLFPFNRLFPNRAAPPATVPPPLQAIGPGNLGTPPNP